MQMYDSALRNDVWQLRNIFMMHQDEIDILLVREKMDRGYIRELLECMYKDKFDELMPKKEDR